MDVKEENKKGGTRKVMDKRIIDENQSEKKKAKGQNERNKETEKLEWLLNGVKKYTTNSPGLLWVHNMLSCD